MPETLLPTKFHFTSYSFEPELLKAFFHYEIAFSNARSISFTEELVFPQPFTLEKLDSETLTRSLEGLHLMLGISYYKLYCPKTIVIPYALGEKEALFWTTIYRKGLGEFFFQNKLDPHVLSFPSKKTLFTKKKLSVIPQHQIPTKRVLLGIGGGKDSIVAGEILKKNNEDITALLIETERVSPISQKVIEIMDVPTLTVQRFLDPKIFLPHPDSYNGHIPISAVFAFVGYFTALLYDYASVIVGNEQSSNSGNTLYRDLEINHQWSKSSEFESLFQDYTRTFLSPHVRYFSLLRPFHEIRIAKMFSQWPEYFFTFSSCNQSYRVHKEPSPVLWCGKCPKCVFVFTLLAPFIKRDTLIQIFSRNLFEDTSLLPLFRDILGIGTMKPFDCVGTFEEARVAFSLAKDLYSDTPIIQTLSPEVSTTPIETALVFQTSRAHTLPDKYKLYGIENVLILGYGKEGKVTEEYLQKFFPHLKLTIKDGKDDPDYLQGQERYDLIIKTPGIPKESITGHYTTATNLFFSQIPQLKIGVTGTKGKSTTASLIFHLLKEAGHPVVLLGNIGSPMLQALTDGVSAETIFVIELSSYQLDDIAYSPEIGVFLNLFPDHLTYHQTLAKYRQAKENIFRFQNQRDLLFYNPKSLDPKEISTFPSHPFPFSKTKLPKIKTALIGKHNQDNIRAALSVVRLFTSDETIIAQALTSFIPLPHRLQYIGEYSAVHFYDDAISTTPESTIEALLTLPQIDTLFLGGEDRGYDFNLLEKTIRKKKIRNIVLFPDTGKRILTNQSKLNILNTTSMEEAVRFAFAHTRPGYTCLLSTASPSYTLWENFEAKGDDFQHWIKVISTDAHAR